MSQLDNKKRMEVEKLIYDTLDAVDKTHTNSDYYKELFAGMNNDQFYKFAQRRLPFRFHQEIFKVEPKMYEIIDGFKVLDKPLFETVKLPYLFENPEGIPVESKECLVVYMHIKRMKQMITKKNSTAIEISQRDMKTGLLLNEDKGGKETDREFESLAVMGLENTMDEFARIRADGMRSKSEVYNIISTQGFVTAEDVVVDKTDSLAKNMLNVYFIGANIHTNLIDEGYMTPHTMKNKQQGIVRKS